MPRVAFTLSELGETDVDWLSENGSRRQVDVGTLLIEQGRPIPSLYVILEGRFSLYGAAEDVGVGPGEILGEMSLVDARPPSADVVASEDSRVLDVPRAALLSRLAGDDAFAARFYKVLAALLADRLRAAAVAATGVAAKGDVPDPRTATEAAERAERALARLRADRRP
jgi:CRP/FNR family transcriptional regulator, cyclic AMP receptor protein